MNSAQISGGILRKVADIALSKVLTRIGVDPNLFAAECATRSAP
jgi:hypothetical protein